MVKLSKFALALAVGLGCAGVGGAIDAPAAIPMPTSGLCAHQGYCPRGRGIHPNTVASLQAAVAAGAAMVEFDVHPNPTNRAELIVFHDGKQRTRACVPTFDAAIDCLPKSNLWINVHFGGPLKDARKVARKIKEKGRLHQAFLTSGPATIKAAREEVPELLACNSARPDGIRPGVAYTQAQFESYLSATQEAHCQFLQPRALWCEAWNKRAHEAGIRVIYSPHGGIAKDGGIAGVRRAGTDFVMVGNDLPQCVAAW